jgi:hypothetical protein
MGHIITKIVIFYHFCEGNIPEPCMSVILQWILLFNIYISKHGNYETTKGFGGEGRVRYLLEDDGGELISSSMNINNFFIFYSEYSIQLCKHYLKWL